MKNAETVPVGVEPNSETLVDAISDKIYSDILNSSLQEGDLFMTCDSVALRYGVSRTVAREALSQLRGLGVLKSRQRKGVLVSRPDPVQLMARWIPLYCQASDPAAFRKLAELRYTFELGAVDLAIRHATDELCRKLADLAGSFEKKAAKGHTPEADRIDLAFHQTLLEMTGNTLVAGMHHVLATYFQASTQFDPRADASKAIREHHLIAEAFARRDGETVRALLRSHLANTVQPEAGEGA